MNAICTGCGVLSNKTGEYSKDDPVTDDGTYEDGYFVCTTCYCQLIEMGHDVGEPRLIQRKAARLLGKAAGK